MCSNQEELKHINIYLTDRENTILKKSSADNMSQSYIIQSHDKMSRDYALMKQRLDAIQSEKDLLEEYNDRLEHGRTNLMGFVKNLVLMKRLNEDLSKKYAKFQDETSILLVGQYELLYEFLYIIHIELLMIMVMMLFLWYFRFIRVSDLLFTIVVKGIALLYRYYKFPLIGGIGQSYAIKDTPYHTIKQKYLDGIKEKYNEIKELENGNLFLSDTLTELIDLQ